MQMIYDSLPQAYHHLLRQVMSLGKEISPRGQLTRELLGYSFTLRHPWENVVTQKTRKVNISFMAAEFLWMITGSNDARIIGAFNSKILPYSDDGVVFKGAYGPKLIDQLPYIVQTLKDDPDSRQALLTLWRERPGPSKDIPCTIAMQFFIRNDLLEMLVYMRSNDLWLGLPYDVFNFTMIQGYVASALGLGRGPYHHTVGSLHLYERNFTQVKACLAESLADLPTVITEQVSYPLPPTILACFYGFGAWANDIAVSAEATKLWLYQGAIDFTDWDALLRLCAYRFHKDKDELPAEFSALLNSWEDNA